LNEHLCVGNRDVKMSTIDYFAISGRNMYMCSSVLLKPGQLQSLDETERTGNLIFMCTELEFLLKSCNTIPIARNNTTID